MMYFYLHAFWQNSVIIHKWLATVTWIRESASCQKSKHQNSSGPCRIRVSHVDFICCLIPRKRSSFEYGSLCPGLQKLKELAQSIKKKAYSHFSHSVFCLLASHFRYLLHVKKRAHSITVRELFCLSQKMIWSLCPSAFTVAIDVFCHQADGKNFLKIPCCSITKALEQGHQDLHLMVSVLGAGPGLSECYHEERLQRKEYCDHDPHSASFHHMHPNPDLNPCIVTSGLL